MTELTPDDLDELARRAQGGDSAALDQFLAAVRPRVLAACRGVLPHLPDAEDACQDALISVTRRLDTWHGRGHVTSWLHAVAVNAARSAYRRMRAQAMASDPQEFGPLERPDPRTTSVIAGTRLDLLEAMEQLEADHPQLVEPLLLRDVYEMPYADIAEHLGVPVGTVKAHIHRARALTRPLLREQSLR